MEEKDYLEYWTTLKDEVEWFDEVDDVGVVFGSSTRGFGHHYKVLPVVSDRELIAFERRNGLDLPIDYRTYLQAFGAGGAGPDYGICDFHKSVQHEDFSSPFPLTEAEFTLDQDFADDDPIWDLPGTAVICSHGCGIESSVEINGPNPGEIWCLSGVDIFDLGSFYGFYRRWAEKTRRHLERYDLLKTVIDGKPWTDTPKKITFEEITRILGDEHRELDPAEASYVPEGEIWVYFKDTPGRIILNDLRQLVRIEPMMLS